MGSETLTAANTHVIIMLHGRSKGAFMKQQCMRLTFSGGKCTDFPSAYSCAPNSPRVMSHLADLPASSSSSPGGQLSVSTSDKNTDVLGPRASYTESAHLFRRLASPLMPSKVTPASCMLAWQHKVDCCLVRCAGTTSEWCVERY